MLRKASSTYIRTLQQFPMKYKYYCAKAVSFRYGYILSNTEGKQEDNAEFSSCSTQ